MRPPDPHPVALTIAGSDSFGGAGIQADLKTFFAFGVHGATAITALTAQNSLGVSSVHAVPADFVKEQISQIVSDAPVAATKTGMLWDAGTVEAVAEAVSAFRLQKLIVDPVLHSTSKAVLMRSGAGTALIEKLFPLALIVTPNLEEASFLTGTDVRSLSSMREAARILKDAGPRWVLVKGGHLDTDATDLLFDGSAFTELPAGRVATGNTHGSGCTLAAAIAAGVAWGDETQDAVRAAKAFVTGAIAHSYELGSGPGPVNQRWRFPEKLENPM